MYSIIVLLAVVSCYALIEALERNRSLWWVVYAATTTFMFYTHVATVLEFAAQCLYVVLTRGAWGGRERNWLFAVGALTVPYVPIALWALTVIGGRVSTWQPDVGLWDAVKIFGIKFAINRFDMSIQIRAAVLYAALAGLGIVVLASRRRRERWWLLLALLSVVPVVGLWMVSLRQSVFSDRYGIVALPAYLILIAAAVTWLIRGRFTWPLGVVAMFLLIAFAWAPLRDVNRSHSAQKEDWRSAYAWIADHAHGGDVILVEPGYLITTYDYFAQREPRLARYAALAVPSFSVGWFDQRALAQMLHDQAGDATRFWLVQSPDRVGGDDPDAVLESWLSENGAEEGELQVNGARVVLYELLAGRSSVNDAGNRPRRIN